VKESNQLAISFITPFGTYCYLTMPFGLKKFGATYQHCMQKCFADQIDPPYVYDIVVKAHHVGDLIAMLDATFANLQTFSVKLNPKKCTFGVPKGKLLGYIVSKCGIKANPKKIMTIARMAPSAT
jgi:hypothetical protein